MHSKHRFKLTVLALALVTVPAAALADTGSLAAIIQANNEVGIAITGDLTNYQEHITPGPSDIESGWQPGFAVKGSYMGNPYGLSHVYANVHYARSSGDIAYLGSLSNGASYDGTDDAIFNRVMGRLGMGFQVAKAMMATPYLTGGYQSWNRKLVGPYGYTEDYHAGLIGLGAKFQYAATSRLVLGADAEWMAVIGGSMTPSDVPGYGDSLGTARFGTTGEEVVGLNADYRIRGPLHLYGGLEFTHFNYTGGKLNYGASEPLSSTNQFDVDAGIAYSF